MTLFALRSSVAATALVSVTLLAGCGGGSGSSGSTTNNTPPAATKFPIQQAMHNMYANGYQKTYTVTGTAVDNGQTFPFSGTLQVSETLVNANATFNGQAAIEDVMNGSGSVTIAGQTFDLSSFVQTDIYQTANNTVLGVTTPTSYCINQGGNGYPTTAVVGASGVVSSVACFTDSSKTTTLGTENINYAVTAGSSATSAIVTLTFTVTSPSNQQPLVYQANYSVDTSANINAQSMVYNINVNGVQVNFTAQ
jgi:hypothetical protein